MRLLTRSLKGLCKKAADILMAPSGAVLLISSSMTTSDEVAVSLFNSWHQQLVCNGVEDSRAQWPDGLLKIGLIPISIF